MAEKVPPAATSHGIPPVDYHTVDRGRRLVWRLATRSRDRITDYSGRTQDDRVSVSLGSAARTRRTNEFGREQQRLASRLAQNEHPAWPAIERPSQYKGRAPSVLPLSSQPPPSPSSSSPLHQLLCLHNHYANLSLLGGLIPKGLLT